MPLQPLLPAPKSGPLAPVSLDNGTYVAAEASATVPFLSASFLYMQSTDRRRVRGPPVNVRTASLPSVIIEPGGQCSSHRHLTSPTAPPAGWARHFRRLPSGSSFVGSVPMTPGPRRVRAALSSNRRRPSRVGRRGGIRPPGPIQCTRAGTRRLVQAQQPPPFLRDRGTAS